MSTNILSLDRAIQNTILWLNDIQSELGWDNRDNVYKATKAVLQALRDRLPFEEVVHLAANLPMVMKGMMLDGYDFKTQPERIHSVEEFYSYIQQYYDWQRREMVEAEQAAKAVITVLNRRMGGGEMTKVAAVMPEKVKRLFEESGVEVQRFEPSAAPTEPEIPTP